MLSTVRPPAVAGMFYPSDDEVLADEIHALLQAAPAPAGPCPKALIVPHAGYVYSGPTAAAAYVRLRQPNEIRRVVLIGPCHRVAVAGLAIPSVEAFATPLGTVPLDVAAMRQLSDLPQVAVSDAAHALEHSLEVQLPFLQAMLGKYSLVPLLVGDASPEAVGEVLERLWGGEETLIVVSSDLSHFLTYGAASQVDRQTCDAVLHFDGHLSPYQACGAYPINGFLPPAQRRGLQAELINLCNSGDTAGDRQRVVGYAAFAFYPGEAGHA